MRRAVPVRVGESAARAPSRAEFAFQARSSLILCLPAPFQLTRWLRSDTERNLCWRGRNADAWRDTRRSLLTMGVGVQCLHVMLGLGVSLGMMLAIVALWVRSYWVCDNLERYDTQGTPE